VVLLTVLTPHQTLAQTNPLIGTWRLNTTKSKSSTPLPQSQTTRAEANGDATKNTTEGTAANGTPVSYSWTAKFDEHDYPITGKGPSGAETISIKRLSANSFHAELKKGGKVVQTAETEYSKDGKTRTQKVKGTDEKGKPTTSTLVYERQ
jgi:hypothetical protein